MIRVGTQLHTAELKLKESQEVLQEKAASKALSFDTAFYNLMIEAYKTNKPEGFTS